MNVCPGKVHFIESADDGEQGDCRIETSGNADDRFGAMNPGQPVHQGAGLHLVDFFKYRFLRNGKRGFRIFPR